MSKTFSNALSHATRSSAERFSTIAGVADRRILGPPPDGISLERCEKTPMGGAAVQIYDVLAELLHEPPVDPQRLKPRDHVPNWSHSMASFRPANDTGVQRRTREGAQRPTHSSDCNAGLDRAQGCRSALKQCLCAGQDGTRRSARLRGIADIRVDAARDPCYLGESHLRAEESQDRSVPISAPALRCCGSCGSAEPAPSRTPEGSTG